jgi:exosortase A-associated hydrolase 2
MRTEAFFLPLGSATGEQRFCLFYPTLGDKLHGLMLFIHPFAEEMNKSRRMAAIQARAFAQAGYAVLQIDLKGCGDSSGDFGDATWQHWVNDVLLGIRWLRERHAAYKLHVDQLPLWAVGIACRLSFGSRCRPTARRSLPLYFLASPSIGKDTAATIFAP